MRHLLTLSVAFLLAVAALDAAAPPVAKPVVEDQALDDTQDVLYLGPGRPSVLRLHLRSGGKPVVERWKEFMAKFFAYLDRNDSGGLDRSEARMVPPIAQMQQILSGNIYNYFPSQGTASVDFLTLDANRDGKVTLDEFEDFYLKGGAGPVNVSTNLLAGNTFAYDPMTDKLFDLLDTNKDGKLSRAEFDAAEQVLKRLDTNDDELISLAELGGNSGGSVRVTRELLRQPNRPGRQAFQMNPLVLLPRSDVPRRNAAVMEVVRSLIKRTAQYKENKLTLEETGFPKAFFDKYDTNKDGKLDALELAKWARGKPEGEFTVRLASQDSAMMMKAPRKPGTGDDDMSLTMGNVRLTVVPSKGASGVANAKEFFLGQLRAVDTDRKGFVARRQLNAQSHYYLLAIFDLADHNGDGRVTEAELKKYIDTVQAAYGAQVNLSLTSSGQGLFQALDTNGDGQLSVRELRQAWARLARFDANKDGCIGRDEFPMQFNLNVGPDSNGAGFVANIIGISYTTPPTVGGRGPIWFRKMDRNGDGDVSRTEWLGSKADFDRIDTNKDGLVSAEEAEAFDESIRKK